MGDRESNFVFKRVLSTTVRFAKFHPIGGSSFIPTPKELVKKMALVNVQNKDTRCFLYAIASAIHPANRNPHRSSKYDPYLSEFNITGLKFPLAPKDISKFEDFNPKIAINVLHYDADKVIVPLVHSNHLGREHEINLFLLSEECELLLAVLRSRLLYVVIDTTTRRLKVHPDYYIHVPNIQVVEMFTFVSIAVVVSIPKISSEDTSRSV